MPFLAQRTVPISTQDLLSWTFDNPPYDLDKPIYLDCHDPSISFSSRQSKTAIRKIAAGLQNEGLQRGETVCIHSFNDVHYPLLVLGIIAAGGVFTGTNPGYTTYELAHHLKASDTKIIIAEPEILGAIEKAAKAIGVQDPRIFVFDNAHNSGKIPAGYRSWRSLLDHGETDWPRFDDLQTTQNTTAMLLFSSGTSGLPKPAIATHYNLVAQQTLVFEHPPVPYERRRIMSLPVFHAASAPNCHISPLRGGYPTYIMRRFEVEKFLRSIEEFSITEWIMVPPQVVAIINSPLGNRYSWDSVEQIQIGAAPLDKKPQARFKALVSKDIPVTQGWGMSETCCIGVRFPYPEKDETGSIGRWIDNIDVKIIDEDGNDITGYDVLGEVCVRGPTVSPGYFGEQEATKNSWKADGWFHTGDIMYCDSKTRLWYIVDRRKELIKVRAFQVAPPEIEGVLLTHPAITDAAVIGVYGPDNTELPRAYVVRAPSSEGQALTEDAVKKLVEESLAKYKWLAGGVVFTDSIPKTASGKILKRLLREQASRELKGKL
ncbi:hypothetical protein BDY21DRAFT_348452 [Lineolata rhizophorae]|uniref:AMP-binding enzyme n=1 Tax=Lineolata rhizophorae TaxID=578093 RepID=A0A6A6NXV1_9PEZI|nr:hypothetical protein BDY21DRAFT_348452 [Lineolata rhizophorae]